MSNDALERALEEFKRRYSDQADGTLLCRDCGGIVKNGFLAGHDGLHDAIGWPARDDVPRRHELTMILRDEEMSNADFIAHTRESMRTEFLRALDNRMVKNVRWTIRLEAEDV